MNSKQFISGVLSLAITSSICTSSIANSYAIDTQNTQVVKSTNSKGEIALTINFALPQTKDKVERGNIKLKLNNDSDLNSTIMLSNGDIIDGTLLSNKQVSVSSEISDTQFGSYNVVLSGLELGQYTFELTGNGYQTVSHEIDLTQYSQHIVVSTDDGTFSLGDVNGDGVVNSDDQLELQKALGSQYDETTAKFDLDGDEKIDITDLSYVNQNKNLSSNPIFKNTKFIGEVEVDTSTITTDEGQNIQDIFSSENQTAINIKPSVGSSGIEIPVTLSTSDEGVTLSEIKITSPATEGAIQEGTAVVEFANGEIKGVPFSQAATRMARASVDNVITINLGNKVAVKKVTIKVEKVEGEVNYASVSKVEFLQDVSVNTEDTSKVKNLAASVGDEQVNLAWSAVNNVTGYTVYYGTSQDNMNITFPTSTNSATIEGLKNYTTYYFKVVATSDGWEGTPSAVITATPISLDVPGKPSNIQIKPADSSLRVSWGQTKNALSYQVYYREQGSSEFIKFGDDIASISTVITGLKNDVTYEIAIKAGNKVGYGDYSAIATGKPEKEGFEMPNLPTEDRIYASSISMKDSSNVNWSLCPNFNVNHLTDNDVNTYWVAKNYWYDSDITYTFDTPQDMNYAIIVPYLDSKHKNVIKTYSVVAKDENGNVVSQVSTRSARLTADNYIIVTFPQAKNIKTLTISLAEVEGGGARVSISEIAFYKSSTLADDIANLFEDNTFTSLKSQVELDDITALEAQLNSNSSYYMDIERLRAEISLAKSLYNGDKTALGRIKGDFVSRSASNDNNNFGQSASALQPIGVSAKAGSTIAIYADIPQGEQVSIIPTQYYGESGIWKGNAIKLESGRNYITIPKIGNLSDTRGGALYLTYSGANADKIKIHILGNSNDMFETPILDLSNWYNLDEIKRKSIISDYITELKTYVENMGITSSDLRVSIRNATEIATPSILLSMPADRILSGLQTAKPTTGIQSMYPNILTDTADDITAMTEAMYQNVLAWEEELFVANMVQGIIPANTKFDDSYRYPLETRQNIRYMRMFAGAFMYAAGEHIGVEYDSCAPLAQGKPTNMTSNQAENGLFGWGIAHEIGHNMDKIGYAEITNNIYSLAMQAWDGNDMTSHVTRLTTDKRWDKIFNKTAQAREGMANDVFVQLGMYWQLHLAYDNAENPLEFYNKFFTKLKSNDYSNYTKDERIALIASEIVKRDLSEFFTRWGMKLGQNALDIINGYEDENRAIWYLNDNSREARLNDKSGNNSETSVQTNVKDNIVTLTMSNNDSSTIQGYEIIRNGMTIGFTTTNTFEDNLGAANNLTYTYTVVPVDILGNVCHSVTADEIRISYDKTISKDLYDIVNQDGLVTITMKNGAVPVTGLKITGTNAGQIIVNVKDNSSNDKWTPAKNTTVTSDTNIIYFNKPNTDNSDTRIWTYDVSVMEIEGLSDGANVELLDYPGDKVDFYKDATVGILKDDYRYGDDSDSVIKEGTLVIIGTYRGDPAYNHVEVQAVYNTTPEAGEAGIGTTSIERAMNGYTLMFAEIPEDGAVSDTSDGFFIFVPDLEAENALNKKDNVTDKLPLEIKLKMYRSDSAESTEGKRLTSETLWLGFPDEDSLPQIEFTNDLGATLKQ